MRGRRPAGRSISCPSCGAPRSLHNPGIVMFACEFCSSVVYWDEDKVTAAGNNSLLTEGFSRLYRDATGSFHQKRFRVLGRIRYSFGEGLWDEWFLETSDGSSLWLTEDQHELAEQREIEFPGIAAFDQHYIGQKMYLRESEFAIQEMGNAECVGLEGELPKNVTLGETYPYLDATSLDGRYSLGLEFDAETPTAFLGRWLKYSEIKLDDEGDSW
ncbi:MAG: DUF4178 domain-containing protein [Acidobacteriota bacterium]